jgi:PAS domain S-box-containing protein
MTSVQRSLDILREFADVAPAMMWVTGADNLCQWVNRTCLEYMGRTLEQERGLGWADFVHPDDRESCLSAVQTAFERQEEYAIEYRVLRADGEYRWILDRARPRRDGDGRFAGVVGVAFDISEQKAIQEAVRRSEARYHAIVHTSVDGIVILDDEGRFVEVNDALCALLRGAREDVVGRHFTDFLPVGLVQEGRRAFAELRRSGQFMGEMPLRALDGTLVELDWRSRASFAPGLHLSVAREIGSRKRAERGTRLLVEAGHLLASSLDVESTLPGLVRLAVQHVAEIAILHWVRDAEVPRVAASAHQDPALQPALESWLTSAAGIAFLRRTGRATRPDHAAVPGLGELSLMRIPLSLAGALRGELVFGGSPGPRTAGEPERLLAEELERRIATALEQARLYHEAQESNRVKDEFLATLSHELRTPLNAIVGWSHVLQQGPPEEATVRRAADIIARNAQAQVQLISDLLDVSRIVAGKLRLNPGLVDLGNVVEAALDAIRPTAEARQLHVRTRLERASARLWGDADRLQQVAWNLLTNAVKFTPRGGLVDVVLERRGSDLLLSVRDDGPGIEPGFLPYVFDRFRQADASTTRPHGGLGLGMAIVRHLVEAHGGEVTAANREDARGALFTVRLPASVRADAAVPPPPACTAVTLRGIRVLVVDDEEDSREIMMTVLSREGAEVLTATCAAEALDLVRSEHPDVLISDIQMAGEDGYSLLRRLRALPADQGGLTPAAALSAYAGLEHRSAALLAGFQTHLAKPVLPTDVISVVAGLASRG